MNWQIPTGRGWRWILALALGNFADDVRAAEESDVVHLPPFIVEDFAIGPMWTYAQIPGFEILARCPDWKTREIVLEYYRAYELMRLILPKQFTPNFDVPKTLILYDEDLWPPAAREAVAEMLRGNSLGKTHGATEKAEREAQASSLISRLAQSDVVAPVRKGRSVFFPNQMLTDVDAMAIFSLAPRQSFDPSGTFLTPEYLGHLLGRRAPKLPSWFVVGFLANYGRMNFGSDGIRLPATEWPVKDSASLLPMGEFLADGALESFGADAKAQELWFAQAELFVRWGIDPAVGQREAFWKFLERAAKEPASDKMVRECFDAGFAQVLEQLARYRTTATTKACHWRIEQSATLPSLELRRATHEEIARIKGDWERLETDYVRRSLPELEEKYLELARRTLRRADTESDAPLLAVKGLCEVDAGNDGAAREFLEKAVAARVVRPRAYYELARIRFVELQAKSTRDDGKIGFEPASELFDLLAAARRQSPPMVKSYLLAAAIWENCVAAPRRSDLADLAEGAALFSDDGELVQRVAKLYLKRGEVAEADALVVSGLRSAPNELTRRQLSELRQQIAATPAK